MLLVITCGVQSYFQVFGLHNAEDPTMHQDINGDVRPGCVIVLQHALSGLFLGVSPDAGLSSIGQAPLQTFSEQSQPCWFVVDSFQIGDDGSPYICLQSVFSGSFLSLQGGMPCVTRSPNKSAMNADHRNRWSPFLNVTILTRDPPRSLLFGDIVHIHWPTQKKALSLDIEDHLVASSSGNQECIDVSAMWRLQPCYQSGPVMASRLNATQPFVLQHLRSGLIIGIDENGRSCALTHSAAGKAIHSLNFRSTTVSTASLSAGDSLFIMTSNSQPLALSCSCSPPSFVSPSSSDICVVTHVPEVHYRFAVKILMRRHVFVNFRDSLPNNANSKRGLSSNPEIGDTTDIDDTLVWLGNLLNQSGTLLPSYQDLMSSSGIISSIMLLLEDIRLCLKERRRWPWPSRIIRLYRHASYLVQAVCVDNASVATALSPHWFDLIRFCGLGAGFASALVIVFKAKPIVRDPKVLMQCMFERFQDTQSPELVEAISLVTEYVDNNIDIKLLVLNMLVACDSSIPQLVISKEGNVFCKSRKDVSDSASRTLPISHDPLNVNMTSDSDTFSAWHLNVFMNVTRLVIALATGSPIGIIRGLRSLTIISPFTPASIISVFMQDQASCTIKTLFADLLVALFVKVDPIIQTPTVVRMVCANDYAVILDSPPGFDNIPSFSSLYSHGDGVTTLLLEAIQRQLRYHRMGSILSAATDENKLTLSFLKLFLALLHTNIFGECGRKQIVLFSNFFSLLMSMLHGHSDVPHVKAESRYENVYEHETTMAIKVQICNILSHFLDAWVNRLCSDFFDIVSNQDAGIAHHSKIKSAPFFFHRSKINPITNSSRLATPQEIYDALLGENNMPPFYTTSPETSKPIPLHDVVADLLRYHNQELRLSALRLGLKHIGLISTFYDTVPRVHYIQCREDAQLAALFSHTRLSVLHLSLDFENVALITIALQNIANALHVLSGKSLVIDGVELELKVFKTVESRMSLAEAMDLFQQLFLVVDFYYSTPSLYNLATDMNEQFIGICYQILVQYAHWESVNCELNSTSNQYSNRLESWLPRIIRQSTTSASAPELACAILSDRLDVRLGISSDIIETLIDNLVSYTYCASQGAVKVIQALILCKGISVPLQQHTIFNHLYSNYAASSRIADISIEAEAAIWGSVVEMGADDSAVTRQLINCNIVDVISCLCSGANPTAAKHASLCRKSWTLHSLLTCRLLPLVSTNRGNDRLSGRMLQSYLLLLDVLYIGVDEMIATVSEYNGISDLIACMAKKFVELFSALGGSADMKSQHFLLNTLLPFMCHCFNCFPDLVSRHFVSQMPTMKTHAVRLIEHMSPSQQRNLRFLFDIPANALTRSVSSKNTSKEVEQPSNVENLFCFPNVLYNQILLQAIGHMPQMKGISNRDKCLKSYSGLKELLGLFDAAAIHECYTSRCDRLDCIVRSLRSTENDVFSFGCMTKLMSTLTLSLYLDPKRDLSHNIVQFAQGNRRPWKDAHTEVVFVTNFAQLGTLSLALQGLTSDDSDCEIASLEFLTTISSRFSSHSHVRDLFRLACLQQEFRQVAVKHMRLGFSNVTTILALSEMCRLVGVPQSSISRAPCYRAFSKNVHLLTILGAYNGATKNNTFSSYLRQRDNSDELLIIEVASFMSNLIPFCASILGQSAAAPLTAIPQEQFLSMLQSALVAISADIDGHIGYKEKLLATSLIVDVCSLLEELSMFAAHCNSDHPLRQPVHALAISCLYFLRVLFNDKVPDAAFGVVRVHSIFKIADVLLKDVDGDRQSMILNDADNSFNFPSRYPAIVHALIVLKRLHAHEPIASSINSQIMFRPALHTFSNIISSVEVAAPDKSRVLVFFPISRAASVYLNSHKHRSVLLDKVDHVHNRPKDIIRHIMSACIEIQARSRFLKTSLMEIFFGHSGLLFISMSCIVFLNLMLFFSASTYEVWQQYFEAHVSAAIYVTGCLHVAVSILRLLKYAAFDFVSESWQLHIEPEKVQQNVLKQKIRNNHDGCSDYVITFTTSEITSGYMFQRLKARVHGIRSLTAWSRVEVEFMSKTEAQQPYLSGKCTCRLVDVGEVEQVQLDIEGDSVLLSSVMIENTDSGRCWKSSGSEVWLHPGSPIHVQVNVTFDNISSVSGQLAGVNYFRLFSSVRLLLMMIIVVISTLGTFLNPMFFVLLFIDVALHLPLVHEALFFVASLCIWPLIQIVVLVMIAVFLSAAWMFLQFRESMLDYGYR
jgi:hypothetical protein